MTIKVIPFLLGPIENNTFLVFDPSNHAAVVIDPSFDMHPLIGLIQKEGLQVKYILITHAHFDHIAGVNELLENLPIRPTVALHPGDLDLWKDRGEALQCGYQMDPLPAPDHYLVDGETISCESFELVAHHTPGHSPGHVVFSLATLKILFTGDVIFAGSIGRTDLAGGSYNQLIASIRTKILCLPDDTHLLPGHGPETTVGTERCNNPYLL